MSTSETPEQPHPRRRQLTVASVAMAVLLAGGGGAYWASNATESGADGARAAGGGSEPPPLVLDSAGLAESGDTSGPGVAPGEPDPAGTVYEAEGRLPEGPGTAVVLRPDGDVTRAEVSAVAEKLEVPGEPVKQNGRWHVGSPKDGSGPLLTVENSRGSASWSYVRYRPTADDFCGKPKEGSDRLPAPCPGPQAGTGTQNDSGDPVSAERAKDAVRPVLESLHLENAELDASATYDALRVVNAQPEAEGLPVEGWVSSFTVDSTGRLVRGHGHLGDLVRGAEYPVMTADETLKALNKHRSGRPEVPSCDGGPRAEPEPGSADIGGYPEGDDVLPCTEPGTGPEGEEGGDNTATVTDATFVLAAEYSKGKPVLVPAWTYQVRTTGGEGTYDVTFPAVEPEFLRTPGGTGGDTPVTPGGDSQAPVSYTADGRELTITFWGGVCHDYRATAKATGEKVAVTVQPEKDAAPEKPCVMVAKEQQVTVELDKPLNGREVVDARTGKELPSKK